MKFLSGEGHGPHWWEVSIGSDNGFGAVRNQFWPKYQPYGVIRPQWTLLFLTACLTYRLHSNRESSHYTVPLLGATIGLSTQRGDSCWKSFHVITWASCQIRKIAGAHAPGMPGTFSPSPQVSDPDMHHGTCVTHVPWCMPGSLTSGFLLNRRRGETFPAFPAHAQPAILCIW